MDPVCGFRKTDDDSGAIRFVHSFMYNGRFDLYPYRVNGNSDDKSITFVQSQPQGKNSDTEREQPDETYSEQPDETYSEQPDETCSE